MDGVKQLSPYTWISSFFVKTKNYLFITKSVLYYRHSRFLLAERCGSILNKQMVVTATVSVSG